MDNATFHEIALATVHKVALTPAIDPLLDAEKCKATMQAEAERIWEEEARQRNIIVTVKIEIWYHSRNQEFLLNFYEPGTERQIIIGLDCMKWRENVRDRHG